MLCYRVLLISCISSLLCKELLIFLFCHFSKRDIPCNSYQMHTLHCIRNITLCMVCDEAIPKREFEEHKQNCTPNKSSDNENDSNKENNVGANASLSAASNITSKSNSSIRKSPEKQKVSVCSTL